MPPRSPRKAKPGDPMVAVAYIRASTEEQQLSPEAQRATLERFARDRELAIVAWHEEQVSGAAPIDKRPIVLAALSDCRDRGAGVLLVARRDRLARDVVICAMLEQLAARSGARIVSAAGEGTESDDPQAELYRRILDAFAAYERALIATRTKAAMRAKAARGEATSKPWFGYDIGPGGLLVRNEKEWAIVVYVRAMRDRKLHYKRIVELCAARGYVARTGKPLIYTQIQRLCTRTDPVTVAVPQTTEAAE